MTHDCDNETLAENIRLRERVKDLREYNKQLMDFHNFDHEHNETLVNEIARLHAEANVNMVEICRLRGQVAKLRSVIINRRKPCSDISGSS